VKTPMANNTCSEDMISTAYSVVFREQGALRFNTEILTQQNDDQIDLSTVVALANCETFTLESKSREVFQALINEKLENTKCYLMRTGTVGGAGHFQLLRYVNNQWEIYSTQTNNFKLTSLDGVLLEDAASNLQGALASPAIWGIELGNRMIFLAEMNPAFIINAANYIAQYRRSNGTEDERSAAAMDYVIEHEDFNPEDSYYTRNLEVQAEFSIREQVANQPKISKEELKQIIDQYKTSFFILNILIKILSFGFFNHQSGTIKALKTLLNTDISEFTVKNIIDAINSPSNHDRQKTRRVSFFDSVEVNNHSGTDRILSEIKEVFNPNH